LRTNSSPAFIVSTPPILLSIGHIGGALIHLLLIGAAVVLIVNLLGGRRTIA
jgi:hypothetical protein